MGRDTTAELYTLIIVDDEPAIRSGLADMIDWRALGFSVVGTFEDGRDAFEFARSRRIDVILTDIKMRHMSGLDLARRVRQCFPHTEVVLLTGYQEFELAREAVRVHVRDYVLKPTDVGDLKRIFDGVRQTLDDRFAAEAVSRSMQETARRLFFRDVVNRAITSRQEFDDRFSLLGFDFDPDGSLCCALFLEWSEQPADPAMFSIVERFFDSRGVSKATHYGVIDIRRSPAVVAVATDSLDAYEFAQEIDRAAVKLRTSLQESFGIVITIVPSTIVSGLWALASMSSQKISESAGFRPNSDFDADDAPAGSALSIVRRCCRHLQENCHRDLSLEEVASYAHLSPAYFSTFFRKHVGTTFSDYLTTVRMEKAKEMLREPGIKVMDVASRVGYSNGRYFSQVFKSYTGFTPTEYVRMSLSDEGIR